VAREPDHAPNLLALAEALAASGDASGSRQAARRALLLADEAAATGEPEAAAWRRQASELAGTP